MLRFVAETPAHLRRGKGVFLKAPKRGQDLRVDMPAIGPDTVRAAAKAGVEGIVVSAGPCRCIGSLRNIGGNGRHGIVPVVAGDLMKVFLVAGELSGDRLGGALMEGLRQLVPDVEFAGVGGPLMAAQGLESLFPMDELSVMGIAEVLPKYRHLVKRMHQTADAALDWQPEVMVTIDSPDFCLRVAREVKAKSDLRCVHYVAPSVWAWRPKRAQKMAKHVDQVLALLPFEPPYMEAVGLRCDFVGHPVVTEPVATETEVAAFRQKHGIGDAPLLLALPGSRPGRGRPVDPYVR